MIKRKSYQTKCEGANHIPGPNGTQSEYSHLKAIVRTVVRHIELLIWLCVMKHSVVTMWSITIAWVKTQRKNSIIKMWMRFMIFQSKISSSPLSICFAFVGLFLPSNVFPRLCTLYVKSISGIWSDLIKLIACHWNSYLLIAFYNRLVSSRKKHSYSQLMHMLFNHLSSK